MVRFEAGSHNDTWLSDGYYEAVSRFIMQVFHLSSKKSYLCLKFDLLLAQFPSIIKHSYIL